MRFTDGLLGILAKRKPRASQPLQQALMLRVDRWPTQPDQSVSGSE